MKLRLAWILMILLLGTGLTAVPPVHAAQFSTSWRDMEPNNDDYTMGRKFGRGLVNIGFGWTEIFYQPRYLILEENQRWPAALLGGVARGLYFTGVRLFAGLYEVFTFPIPAPEGYKPLVLPEYPVQARPQADHLDF